MAAYPLDHFACQQPADGTVAPRRAARDPPGSMHCQFPYRKTQCSQQLRQDTDLQVQQWQTCAHAVDI